VAMSDIVALDRTERPGHVPGELVRDFDLYTLPSRQSDVHRAYFEAARRLPDIFWTPFNGGHWVACKGEDIIDILRHPKSFSSRSIVIPPIPGLPTQLPIELDPPTHAFVRRPLAQALRPEMIARLESEIRAVAREAIERIAPLGSCEFMADFAKVLPIHVFLRLVDLPLDDKAYLVTLEADAVKGATGEIKAEAQRKMRAYLEKWVIERRAAPGDDLLSEIVNVEVRGERISDADALSYTTLVLFGGLDTVAAMMGFIALFLAEHPGHRETLVDRLGDEAFLKTAIEEMMRRHGIANIARVVAEDMHFRGIEMRAGDRILPATSFVGIDPALNADPLLVDYDRVKPVSAVFGVGPHACPGATLARREIRIFLIEWLTRIPTFRVRSGTEPELYIGINNGVSRLELSWP
jgi:cytochrome P450